MFLVNENHQGLDWKKMIEKDHILLTFEFSSGLTDCYSIRYTTYVFLDLQALDFLPDSSSTSSSWKGDVLVLLMPLVEQGIIW